MNIKKLNKIFNEIDRLEIESIEDIEDGGITKLDEQILSKYKELFDEIYPYCVKEKITNFFDFDIIEELEFDAFSVIDGYIDNLDYACQYDEKYLEQRADVIKKVLKQFKLEKEDEEQYKIELADSIYYTEDKEKAQKMIKEILKKNPKNYFAYETQYKWEKDEPNTNYEKLDQIITKAEEKGFRVAEMETYEEMIKFYQEKGNEEKTEFYKKLFQEDWNELKEGHREIFDEELFDEYDLYDEEDDIFNENKMFGNIEQIHNMINEQEQEELKEAIKEVRNQIKDKVQKDKTFEQYLKEKTEEELKAITTMYSKKSEEKEVKKDVKSILQNRKELFKANIETMTTAQIEALKKLLKTGYKEIKIANEEELDNIINTYFPTKLFGILFAKIQDKKIILHIPKENIEMIKDILNDKEVIKINEELNTTLNFIRGLINTYGVIEMNKIDELYEKCFSKSPEELAEKLILYVVNYQETGMYVDKKNKEKTYLYHGMLDENDAKKIIKKTAKLDYYEYDLEMYLKLSDLSEYVKQTRPYQKLENKLKQEQLSNLEDLKKIVDESIQQYSIMKMIDKEEAEKITRIVSLSIDVVNPFSGNLGKTVERFIIEISEKFPDWNKKGRIE